MRRRRKAYESERLIVIRRDKLKVFGAGFTAGIAASISAFGLVVLCCCL